MQDTLGHVTRALRQSLMLRLASIGGLALLLLIPVTMIGGLVGERQTRRDAAVEDIASKWGASQTMTGPVLVVPVVRRWTEPGTGQSGPGQPAGPVERWATVSAVFLPSRLEVHARLESDRLSRGIFVVPVYRLTAELTGEFSQPRPADLGIAPRDVLWNRAHLAVGISQVQAIQEQVSVAWNGRPSSCVPGPGGFTGSGSGINAPVAVDETTSGYRFSMPIALKGSLSAYFVPFGGNTRVELTSDFRHPKFQGAWLPASRTVSADGFVAAWSIPALGRGYPQAWLSDASPAAIAQSRFGVELQDPIDPYRMAERSVKYAALFILMTFTLVWLVEVLAGVRVHPIQYLLLGAALCVFYLLELSLSEHIPFLAAYGLATLAVVGMVTGYGLVALQRARRAAVVGLGVALLYGYLYVLLTNEDYALLIGSIGLFVMLVVVMLVTRRIDWYTLGGRPAIPPGSPRA